MALLLQDRCASSLRARNFSLTNLITHLKNRISKGRRVGRKPETKGRAYENQPLCISRQKQHEVLQRDTRHAKQDARNDFFLRRSPGRKWRQRSPCMTNRKKYKVFKQIA